MKVEATVVEKTKGPKKIVFKMKRRKGYRRWKGTHTHKESQSSVKISLH